LKRKPSNNANNNLTPVVAKEISEAAKASIGVDKGKYKVVKCAVCTTELSSPTSNASLCWICRRLKISAWRDSDNQLSAPE
jgi:hypothetical protein